MFLPIAWKDLTGHIADLIFLLFAMGLELFFIRPFKSIAAVAVSISEIGNINFQLLSKCL